MSVKTSIPFIKIPIRPTGQTTSQWTENLTPITYLNRGTYNFNYTYAIQASVGTMTNTLAILTQINAWAQPGFKEISFGPKTGTFGAGNTGIIITNLTNNVVIQNDNTPIYLSIQVTIGGGTIWGVPVGNTQYNDHMNCVCILRV